MQKCEIIAGEISMCKQLSKYSIINPIDSFVCCPFCKMDLKGKKYRDPWVYIGAILFCWDGDSHDRKIVIYKGQQIEFDNYYVYGSPWQYVPPDVKDIQIDQKGNVFYIDKNADVMKLHWHGCPDFLKADNDHDYVSYDRPVWTKYLPGIEK